MLSKLLRRFPKAMRFRVMRSFGEVQARDNINNTTSGIARSSRLQFTKEKLVDFGELPAGEIPDALNFDRPSEVTTLDNGVKVATEHYNTGLVTIGVHWAVGSRHETLDNSGVLHFIQHLRFRGTENLTRAEIEQTVQNLGGHINIDLNRERESLYITVQPQKVEEAFALIKEIYNNSTYDENQVEAEREDIYREIIELQRDQMATTLESNFYTAYRDHQFGQPTQGVRENVSEITSSQIKDFVKNYQVGSKMVVVASGNVNHGQIEELTQDAFGGLQEGADVELPNSETPYFTPSLMFMRDDEVANINAGVFFKAPNYAHEDSYAMRFFAAMIGNYRADLNNGEHLNAADRQYNTLHTLLGDLPDLTIQNCFYFPYSDTGLFGNYLFGNEVHGPQMLFNTQEVISEYAYHINQVEIFRARASLFNSLLNETSGEDVNSDIANEVIYLGRRVPRSERAKRLSAQGDQEYLSNIATKWFYDVDLSATAWGPLHGVMLYATYNRAWRRSTLGWHGRTHGGE